MKRERELRVPATEAEEAEAKELAVLLGESVAVAVRRAVHDRLVQERASAAERAPEERATGRRRRRGAPASAPREGRYVELDPATA